MLILGIDPGTQILGYSLLDTEGGKFNILAMDVLYLKRLPDFNQRIRRIYDSTVRIIDSFHPDHLAIEAPFFGKNVQSMLKLGRAQGVAIAAAMRDLVFIMGSSRLVFRLFSHRWGILYQIRPSKTNRPGRVQRRGGRVMSSSMTRPTSALESFSVMRRWRPFSASGAHSSSPLSPTMR